MSKQPIRGVESGSDEEQIVAHLVAHPEFFERHPGVLTRLKLPHQRGSAAISLVERQVLVLRENHAALELKLHELIENGRSPDTPVAVVRWASTPEQQSVEGTLATITEVVKEAGIKPPALITRSSSSHAQIIFVGGSCLAMSTRSRGLHSRLGSSATRPQATHTKLMFCSFGLQICLGSVEACPQCSHT